MKEFPRRFLSLRDKNAPHRRSKSVPSGGKSRPLTNETFRFMFKSSEHRRRAAEEEEQEQEKVKIEDVQRRLDDLNITNVSTDHIKDILGSNIADGDPKEAADFIDMEQKASAGIIVPYNPRVHMLGAENRGYVTCYLDSLLFSMFAKLDAFDGMLKIDFPLADSRHRLVTLLRIWVNMLRSGKLIRTDLTCVIQEALADCGWSDARFLEQQDTSEAFAFITETLQLPLLSLQVDLFHQGKGDKDDHKVVYERLLNLAVPPDPEGKGIDLEDCLEEYFNTRVDVLRDSEVSRRAGTEDKLSELTPFMAHRNSLRNSPHEGQETAMTSSPVDFRPASLHPTSSDPDTSSASSLRRHATHDATPNPSSQEVSPTSERRPSTRPRASSVIQHVIVDQRGRASSTDSASILQNARRKGSTVVRAITIPAWQFFRLIPWHAVSSNEPQNDSDVAMNFNQKPVVGICLKRYAVTEAGVPKRLNTYIDIPDSLRLPRFMLAENATVAEDVNALITDFKLVLQSVICHRGDSLQHGHYIAFARVAPRLMTDNRRHDLDPPPDYEEAQWVRFDDIDVENRVTYVDDIRTCLREEMPYLLFYQVVPMVDEPGPGGDGLQPPSYTEPRISIDQAPTPPATDESSLQSSMYDSRVRNSSLSGSIRRHSHGKLSGGRHSLDIEKYSRKSIDGATGNSINGSTLDGSRPHSMHLSNSTAVSPSVTPEAQSPLITPSDESTASRLSRAASRFAKGRSSRPPSQSSDGGKMRSRLTGLIRPGKEHIHESLPEPTMLNILAAASSETQLAPEVVNQATEASIEHSKTDSLVETTHPKHGHKKGKSKDKVIGGKANPQPDRECLVM